MLYKHNDQPYSVLPENQNNTNETEHVLTGQDWKNLAVLTVYLSATEKEAVAEASNLVLSSSADEYVIRAAVGLFQAVPAFDKRIVVIEEWPNAVISENNQLWANGAVVQIKESLVKSGLAAGVIEIVKSPQSLKETLLPGSIMLDAPLAVLRDRKICALHQLVNLKVRSAYTLDTTEARNTGNYAAFKTVALKAVQEVRWIQDHFKLNNRRLYQEELPSEVNDAYVRLFKLVRLPARELFKTFIPANGGAAKNYGFNNCGYFPDGQGHARIDDWGMAGTWLCRLNTTKMLKNRFLLRTVDALAKALGPSLLEEGTINVHFEDNLENLPGVYESSSNRLTALSIDENTVVVTPGFVELTRDEQQNQFSALLAGRDKMLGNYSVVKTAPHIKPCSVKPGVLVTQIAMVEELRSKDYHHYKCSQKTEGIAAILKQSGFDAQCIHIEDKLGYEKVIRNYQENHQKIVVISIYQVKQSELETYHQLVMDIRAINPKVFIIVEGASTNMAKQFLAISPEVDMLVRVESDRVVPLLAAGLNSRGVLSQKKILDLTRQVEGGLFIRSDRWAIFSKLNRANVNTNVQLLEPNRFMFDMWYSERGCPNECLYCRRDTGSAQGKRIVPANDRFNWMIKRLMLEVTPMVTEENLLVALEAQADDEETLESYAGMHLLSDTFIGTGNKISILILSENALATKRVIKRFSELSQKYGLHKYFIFKAADTTINSISSKTGADEDYIRSVKALGISFVGMGTENVDDALLKWWNKGACEETPAGYNADKVLAVNKALLENGFNPQGIRHNLILSHPEASMDDGRSSVLLSYISPQYNSLPDYLGNGWGNNRFERTFDVAASFASSLDHIQYAETYSLEPNQKMNTVDYSDYFYIAQGTPEYLLRREFRFLKYQDEQLPSWASHYGFPTFYRYAQKNFIKANFSQENVTIAIARWEKDSSREIRCLASILAIYQAAFPGKALVDLLFLLKAHMVSLRMLSFVDYQAKITDDPGLPLMLDIYGVSDLFAGGDQAMVPGTFEPYQALKQFGLAAMTAKVVYRLNLKVYDENIAFLILSAVENGSVPEAGPELRPVLLEEASCQREILEACKTRGFLSRVSYPDSQAFEHLRHLFVKESDNDLFSRVVVRMNMRGVVFPEAVRQLACERLDIPEAEYPLYIKAIKEYNNLRNYYCVGGLFHQMRSDRKDRVVRAVEKLLFALETEENPYILKNAALLLLDLGNTGTVFENGLYNVPEKSVQSLAECMGSTPCTRMLMFGPSLVVFSYLLFNKERLRLLEEEIKNRYSTIKVRPAWKKVIQRPDWISFRLDGLMIKMTGTFSYEKPWLPLYVDQMNFNGNVDLFSAYIGEISHALGRHRLRILLEIRDYLGTIGNRPHGRALLMPEEKILYSLPLIMAAHRNPNMVPLFLARSMEPFYLSWWIMMMDINKDQFVNRSEYIKFEKRTCPGEQEDAILTKSINTLLSDEESLAQVSVETWGLIEKIITEKGMLVELNGYLAARWNIANGIQELKEKNISRGDFVKFLSGFGLDDRFTYYYKMVRNTYFPDLLRQNGFANVNCENWIPLTHFKGQVRKHNLELTHPLPPQSIKKIMLGLDMLGGESKMLSSMQRDEINNYLIIFGDSPAGSGFRNNIRHTARPLLNVVLSGTRFANKLSQSKNPNVLYVDDSSSTATTLYLSFLVVKSFREEVDFSTCNICQRSDDTANVLKETGVVDNIFKQGVWPLEDMNNQCLGFFFTQESRGRMFVSYQNLIKKFWAIQENDFHLSREQSMTIVEEINKDIDTIIDNNTSVFNFIDQLPGIRHDPRVIKRWVLKTCLFDTTDQTQDQIMHNNYYTCFTPFAMGNVSTYTLRENLTWLPPSVINQVPERIKLLYKSVKHADQALEMEGYLRNKTTMLEDDIAAVSQMTQLKLDIQQYFAGRLSFQDIEKRFYQRPTVSIRKSFITKDIILNENHAALFSRTMRENGKVVYKFYCDASFQAASKIFPMDQRQIFQAQKDLSGKYRSLIQIQNKNFSGDNETNKAFLALVETRINKYKMDFPQFLGKKFSKQKFLSKKSSTNYGLVNSNLIYL